MTRSTRRYGGETCSARPRLGSDNPRSLHRGMGLGGEARAVPAYGGRGTTVAIPHTDGDGPWLRGGARDGARLG